MAAERPPDWDWVTAIGTCKATVMFGALKTLAKQNVQVRNAQLGEERFGFQEPDGITFLVTRPGQRTSQVAFQVVGEELSAIAVSVGQGLQRPTTTYTVGLDGQGVCKLRHGETDWDPWQVLKAALEPLLFG